jgi:hypothetical protein
VSRAPTNATTDDEPIDRRKERTMPSYESRYHAAACFAAGVQQGAEGCAVVRSSDNPPQYTITLASPISLAEMALTATVYQPTPGAAPKPVVRKVPAPTDGVPFTHVLLEFRADVDGGPVDPEGFFVVIHRVKVGASP